MPKEKSPEEVYDSLMADGAYEEANLDKDEVNKVVKLTVEDYEFGKSLRQLKKPNWRILSKIPTGI